MIARLPHTNLPKWLWRLWGDSYIVQSIVTLGIPLIVGQLGNIAQQFADTIMVGQYGTQELAAAGFVNNIFNFVIYFILGISYASTPVIGAAYGRQDYRSVARGLIDSIIVNLLCGLVVVALLLWLYAHVGILHQPAEIMPLALPYYLILTLSVPFMAVFNAMKQFSDAVGETKIPMWIMLFSNVLNVLLNWLLIFGIDISPTSFGGALSALHLQFSIPAMGLYGAGIATLVSRIVSVILLFVVILTAKRYRCIVGFLTTKKKESLAADEQPTARHSLFTLHYSGMVHLLLLGLPISIQLGLEASSFNVSAIFMGWLGAIPLAAHQVMCTISTLCFQVVYGIGAAASVLISQFRGMGDWFNVRRTARAAFSVGLTIIVVMIALIFIFRYPLVAAFTTSQEVTGVLMSILPCFFIYQFGDCMQITYANALRGIEQVRRMMLFAFISYIVVSIPCSYYFGFICHLGSVGVWMGLPFGLTTAGLLFYSEFRRQTKKR